MIKWRLLKVHSICNEFVEMHSHMTHKNCTSYINDLLQSTLENQLFHAAAQNFEWYLISFRVSLLLSLPLPYHFVQSLLPLVLVNQTHLLTQHIKILLDLHYHSCNYCQHLLAGNEDIYHKFDELRKKNLYCFPSTGMRLTLKSHLVLEPV